ncbi:MAG: Pyridine nucleotide-disulfide oxidoreductase [Candidatus Uhrbacteria bacterium GW2011_GWD2_52_7]|uniref:Pyridine nucleotide-disulfide oxidoreductase n=1 Tax=Candidatus Uhrbacteria bacterium GW2011_GWD2_52_7 TaxID=1618989 RepID=A0A0G2AD93_9BACT|nr:MAG: Pyridine nucleotide-disulfide oxidoreductase [Candidatus Uhrbacteria bacterium GW2011_GWD2_52_7]
MHRRTRVVILGGGFGGLVTARRLSNSRIADGLDITVVDVTSKHVYAPWLYELATSCLTDASTEAEWQTAQTASDLSFQHLRGYTNVRFRKTNIVGVDKVNKHVLFEDGLTAPYDILVVALGAVPNYFNIQYSIEIIT